MNDRHHYTTTVTWTGNLGTGTSGYKHYSRDFALEAQGKQPIAGTADTAFHGAPNRWNPEEMLLAALSACHQLSYLHLCAVHGLVVTAYVDRAEGAMRFDAESGGGHFEQVCLRPEVTVAAGSPELARTLHEKAHELCFIANSVNFPVTCVPTVIEAAPAGLEAVTHGS